MYRVTWKTERDGYTQRDFKLKREAKRYIEVLFRIHSWKNHLTLTIEKQ